MFVMTEVRRIQPYHRLLIYLTLSRIRSGERDKTFGKLWAIVTPLVQLVLYYFMFNVVFQSRIENFALYLFSAIIGWHFMTGAITNSATSIVSNRGLISEAYFPKEILPLCSVLTSAYDYLFSLVVLLGMTLYVGVTFRPVIAWWPVVFLVQALFTLGFSVIAAALGVFLRDLPDILAILFRITFYLSGTMYDISRLPESLQPWLRWNPVYIFYSSYRNILLYDRPPPLLQLALILLISIFVTGISLRWMRRVEGKFVKHL